MCSGTAQHPEAKSMVGNQSYLIIYMLCLCDAYYACDHAQDTMTV